MKIDDKSMVAETFPRVYARLHNSYNTSAKHSWQMTFAIKNFQNSPLYILVPALTYISTNYSSLKNDLALSF
jgi:hypothetical protein